MKTKKTERKRKEEKRKDRVRFRNEVRVRLGLQRRWEGALYVYASKYIVRRSGGVIRYRPREREKKRKRSDKMKGKARTYLVVKQPNAKKDENKRLS